MTLSLLFFMFIYLVYSRDQEEALCPGNHFLFLSNYILNNPSDLAFTFAEINQTATIQQITYSDELYRTYRIFEINRNIAYLQARQTAALTRTDVYTVTGGYLRVTMDFTWQKKQLNGTLTGTGSTTIISDIITYQKRLITNSTHQLQWVLQNASLVSFSNSISLNKMNPYKQADYDILSNMLNALPNNQTTIKDNLVAKINENYLSLLSKYILQDKTLSFDKIINYKYFDYRGKFQVNYRNTIMKSSLNTKGLYIMFSQVIINDTEFQCGDILPFQPEDSSAFGGLQEFISNSLIKSTLKYALKNKSLDVVLTQQFWQSRAFQFFMGDAHDVMPNSTKAFKTMQQLQGRCEALNDPVFSFSYKNTKSYDVRVHFNCYLTFNTTRLLQIDLVVAYEVAPALGPKYLDFVLNTITGIPTFNQVNNFKIQFKQLADFMVLQTLSLAKGGKVIGSTYKTQMRRSPSSLVKKDYLLLYDAGI